MRGLRVIFVATAVALFLGSGGYLLYGYLTAAKDEQDLEKLAQIVKWSIDAAENAQETQQKPGVRVRFATREPVESVERGPKDAQAEARESRDSESSAISRLGASNNPGGLVEVVQDYLQRTITRSNEPIDTIRIEIVTMPVDENVDDQHDAAAQEQELTTPVRVLVSDRTGSPLSQRTIADQIARITERYITSDKSWIIQNEIFNLDVYVELAPILPQYEALYAQNSDMVGWIKIEGTPVNYPVMQSRDDPQFYLRQNFEKKYAYGGLPFVDSRCDIGESTNNLLVYGHNMKNGTMFGRLPRYESKGFWEQRRVIQFDVLNEARTYEIVGMFRSKQYKEKEEGFRYYEYIDLSERDKFTEYIEQVKKASFIDTGVTADWGDQILTLSTCSYHTDAGTFVVVARRQDK